MNKYFKLAKTKRQEIKDKVFLALNNTNKLEFPVNIKYIVKQFKNCRLIPYSKQMKRRNLSYKEMLSFAGTEDAFTDYENDLYLIYYNDLNQIIMKSNRYRWNIAHELGHILLEHHKKYKKTRIFRNQLSDEEYNKLEAEANYFAAYILFPHSVVVKFKKRMNSFEISALFKISNKASQIRIEEYNKWIHNRSFKEEYYTLVYKLFEPILYRKYCPICNYKFVSKTAKFCPICGNNNLKWKNGDDFMKYDDGYDVDDSGKAKKCPRCNNEEIHYGEYCIICGAYLINKCTGFHDINGNIINECNTIAKGNARYCYKCGEKTTFLENGYLKEWDKSDIYDQNFQSINNQNFYNINAEDDDLPF